MNRLLNHHQSPPGEFVIRIRYIPGESVVIHHGVCGGDKNCHTFGPSPEISSVAKLMIDFLKGNNLPGGDYATVIQQIDEYTCTRLGGMSRWCHDSDKPYTAKSIAARTGGGCCGAKL